MRSLDLYIPGPTQVADDVYAALAEPVMAFYHPSFVTLFEETVQLARQVFETEHDVLIIPGSGTSGLDATINAFVRPGDEVAVVVNGFFGIRLRTIVEAYGARPIVIPAEWGRAVDPNAVEATLKHHPAIRSILVVHSETSTGILNPIREIAEIANRHGLPIVVDAISSLGGVRLPVDAWGIHACITCSQKCLETPPGLALISINPAGWEHIERRGQPTGFYLNLLNWRPGEGRRTTGLSTFPTNLGKALRAALRRIVDEGLANRFARHAQAAATFRAGFKELGFRSFADERSASPTVSTVIPPAGMTAADIIAWLERERGILVARGMGPAGDTYFRVGHQGPTATVEKVNVLLEALAACVADRRIGAASGHAARS